MNRSLCRETGAAGLIVGVALARQRQRQRLFFLVHQTSFDL